MSAKELEAGMYVRLKGLDRCFGKLDSQVEDSHLWTVKIQDGYYDLNPLYDFEKASHNIVDLIEVGDILLVNGIKYTVLQDKKHFENKLYIERITCEGLPRFTTIKHLFSENQIEGILIHEQFEREAYKV